MRFYLVNCHEYYCEYPPIITRNIKRVLQYISVRCYSCDVQTLRYDGNNFFAAAHKLLQLHVNVSSFMRPFRDHNGRFGDL